jgi:protein-S-isoprenylcysteine O-methyltransferase Ste14
MYSGNRMGFIYFTFSTTLAVVAGIESPSLLACLAVPHNLILSVLYLVRNEEKTSNRNGLWLGLIAALLPMTSYSKGIHPAWMVFSLAGYALMIWSLLRLGKSFGIAPADRGLVTQAPYNVVRHPMYLGELAYRWGLVYSSLTHLSMILFVLLIGIQVARIIMEEKIISGYTEYQSATRWRLLPGIW